MFRDRLDAGLQLAEKLEKFRNQPGIVLAVPRGGVPVAYPVAKELDLPLELVLTKKIGHPANPEYAIGAASLTDHFVIPHPGVSESYINNELWRIRIRLREMYKKFMHDRVPAKLEGKTVIIIDDGIATGNTMLATITVLRKAKPAKIIVAVPIATPGAVEKISSQVDELITLVVPEYFYGVGSFYEDFSEATDEEVMYYLDKIRELRKAG